MAAWDRSRSAPKFPRPPARLLSAASISSSLPSLERFFGSPRRSPSISHSMRGDGRHNHDRGCRCHVRRAAAAAARREAPKSASRQERQAAARRADLHQRRPPRAAESPSQIFLGGNRRRRRSTAGRDPRRARVGVPPGEEHPAEPRILPRRRADRRRRSRPPAGDRDPDRPAVARRGRILPRILRRPHLESVRDGQRDRHRRK